jgi:Protein of unknown function (DUF3891)
MIVRPAEGVLHLITQPEHAALARRIMEHWEGLRRHGRRSSILLAIEQHDSGWREPDASPTIDPLTGRIHDFINVPAAVRQAVWPTSVARLAGDPLAAALVAHHAVTVYDRYRSDEAWAGFFPAMEGRRDALAAAGGVSPQALLDDYVFLRIGDLISLVFCTRSTEPLNHASRTFRLDGDRVILAPDSTGAALSFGVTALEVADRPYRSDEDLRDAIARAPAVTLEGAVALPLA